MASMRHYSKMEYWILQGVFVCFLLTVARHCAKAQTEGDPGYEYPDAYDEEFENVLGYDPSFDVPIVNVTVVEGQKAVLPCSVNSLGKYKVAWQDPAGIILTYEDWRVVDDTSFSVNRPKIKEWNLEITKVKYEYQGQYKCTINTTPEAKYKTVMLYVKVPAQIIDELSSDDVTVQEHDTVVLVCNVTGIPHPTVTWFRRPVNGLPAEKEKIGMSGEMIIIQNVSRYCDNVYECVASNGVPPEVSRQMKVTVEFPPEITLPNKRFGQIVDSKLTVLDCTITAFPHHINHWEKDGKEIQSDNSKYTVDAFHEEGHTLTLSLKIHDLKESDYGKYKCVAANQLGQDEESMWLYEFIPLPERNRNQQGTTHKVLMQPLPDSTPSALAPGRKSTKKPTGKKDFDNETPRKPSEPLIDALGDAGPSISSISWSVLLTAAVATSLLTRSLTSFSV